MFPSAQNSISTDAQRHGSDSFEFVVALARAYTLSEIFPLHHPTVLDAMRDVAARLEELEPSVVQVTRTGLAAEEVPVGDPHGHVRELARDLSLSGVTELGLGAPLSLDHVERFLRSLRVVTEDPTLALDVLLAQEGGCEVELALHGGPLGPVANALTDDPPLAVQHETGDEVQSQDVEGPVVIDYPGIAESDLERIEPVSEWTVEQEIQDELVVEPLGAFLSMPDPVEDLDVSRAEIETAPDLAAETEDDESDETDWRTAVRERLLVESQVGAPIVPEDTAPKNEAPEAEAPEAAAPNDRHADIELNAAVSDVHQEWTDDSPATDSLTDKAWWEIEPQEADYVGFPQESVAPPQNPEAETEVGELDLPGIEELADVDVPTAAALPTVELPSGAGEDEEAEAFYAQSSQLGDAGVDAASVVGDVDPEFSEEAQPLVGPGQWTAEGQAQEWGGTVDADPDHLAALDLDQPRPLQELYDGPATDPEHASPANAVENVPVVPVLDESEINSPALAVPPDPHMAAPEELSQSAVAFGSGEAGATQAEPAHAFQAALQDEPVGEGDSPQHSGQQEPVAETSELWEPSVDDGLSSLWDAEASGWIEDPQGAIDGPLEDESTEPFPPVERLAPDGPTLLESEDVEPEQAQAPQDPEVVLLENELAAEVGAEEFYAAPAPVQPPVAARTEGAAPISDLVSQFLGADEGDRPVANQRIMEAASQLTASEDFETIAKGIEVLVRDAVPGDHGAIALARALAEPPVVTALCKLLAEVRDADRRDELVYVFGQMSEVTAPALAKDLSEVPPRAARRNYMDALFRMRTEAVAVAVPMLDDSRWFIVRNGVDILGEAGDEGAVARLAPSLAHPDHRVRRATVMALAKLGGARAGNELIPVLEDPNAEVREGAAMALGHLRVAKALRPLLELLDRDKGDDAQLVILRSLGQIGDPGAVPAIEKRAVGFFFIKPNKAVRIAAYRALAAIGTPHASRLVIDAATDRDAEVAAAVGTMAEQLQNAQVEAVAGSV